MDPETFEQVEIPVGAIGDQARLLEANMRVGIDFVDGRPVSVQFPEVVEVRVVDTTPPVHQQDSTWKPARLSNGLDVMVPQFIKTGDTIRLDAAQLKYMDRARASGR
jgi:elongation factor P